MKRKRTLKTKLFLQLRKMGMLCKKPVYRKPIVKVARTVYPEGEPRMSPNGSGEWYGLVEDKKVNLATEDKDRILKNKEGK
jgi:hypothetical protein